MIRSLEIETHAPRLLEQFLMTALAHERQRVGLEGGDTEHIDGPGEGRRQRHGTAKRVTDQVDRFRDLQRDGFDHTHLMLHGEIAKAAGLLGFAIAAKTRADEAIALGQMLLQAAPRRRRTERAGNE